MRYNLARFDLVSIRLAVDCAQTGSLTAAARGAHLALGDTLFDRHALGLQPTAAGRVFVKHGLRLLQTMDQLDAELADLRRGTARHIHLCASSAAISQFLPHLLAQYGQLHPQVQIDVDEQVSDAAGLGTRLFRQDELVLPAGHRLADSKTALAFADALDEEWIRLTAGAAMLQQQQQSALAAHRLFKLRMQVRSFDAVCHRVASTSRP